MCGLRKVLGHNVLQVMAWFFTDCIKHGILTHKVTMHELDMQNTFLGLSTYNIEA